MSMVVIRVSDPDLRISLNGFLAFKVPGVVATEGEELHVIIRGALTDDAQCRLVERLVWAWRTEHVIDPSADVVLTHGAHTEVSSHEYEHARSAERAS
jgi:hypothetical protein